MLLPIEHRKDILAESKKLGEKTYVDPNLQENLLPLAVRMAQS